MFEEHQKLLIAVPSSADPRHLPRCDLQRSEPGSGAVADVVVGVAFGDPDLQRYCQDLWISKFQATSVSVESV